MKTIKLNVGAMGLALALGLSAGSAILVTITGCAGDPYKRSTGEYIDDKTLSMRVTSALHDNADYKFDDVDVTALKGTLQLSGFVNTSDQKKQAAKIAKEVQGVTDVENSITVKE